MYDIYNIIYNNASSTQYSVPTDEIEVSCSIITETRGIGVLNNILLNHIITRMLALPVVKRTVNNTMTETKYEDRHNMVNLLKEASQRERMVVEFQTDSDNGKLRAVEITEHVSKLEENAN